MIYFGYFWFAAAIGFLVGASNTPVVGSFIAALSGLAAAFFGALDFSSERGTKHLDRSTLGKLLMLFALGLLSGEIIGEAHRHGWLVRTNRTLPWAGLKAPQNTYEALDWIVVQEKLLELGYSQEDIAAIYTGRVKERHRLEQDRTKAISAGTPGYDLPDVYDTSQPFSKRLEEVPANATTRGARGPASTGK